MFEFHPTKVVELENGAWVKVRAMPPIASNEILDDPKYRYPRPAIQRVDTAAGPEYVPAPEGSPEHNAYLEKWDAVDRARNRHGIDYSYYYGIVEWSIDQGETWHVDPPSDWQPDPLILGLVGDQEAPKGVDTRRLQFIKYALITTTTDLERLRTQLYSYQEASENEVSAAEEFFPSEDVGAGDQ